MSLPAIFPARRPPVLFKAILILGCITLGLIPSGILALLPVDERLFLKQPYFLVFFAGVGLSASFITFLVRIPVRYIITNDCLHIVSIARSRWWWCPGYEGCQPTYTIDLGDIEGAQVENPMCPVPLLLLPGPWTDFTGLCCVQSRRRGRIWISPENGRGFVEQLDEARAMLRTHDGGGYIASSTSSSSVVVSSLDREAASAAARHGPTLVPMRPIGQVDTSHFTKLPDGESFRGVHSEVEFTKHTIEGSETLQFLALKYDCQVSDIRKANGMIAPPRTLAGYKTIWIPTTSASSAKHNANGGTDKGHIQPSSGARLPSTAEGRVAGEGMDVGLLGAAEGEGVSAMSDSGSQDCELSIPMTPM